MAGPEMPAEPVTLGNQIAALLGVGATYAAAWLYRFLSGTQKPPEAATHMVVDAMSTADTRPFMAEIQRIASAVEETLDLIRSALKAEADRRATAEKEEVEDRIETVEQKLDRLLAALDARERERR